MLNEFALVGPGDNDGLLADAEDRRPLCVVVVPVLLQVVVVAVASRLGRHAAPDLWSH